jgi:archaemetzincin
LQAPVVEQPRRKLTLVVMGSFRDELIPTLVDALRRAWDMDVQVAPAIALPKSAYHAPRRRYRAERLAEHLETLLGDNPEDGFILGLTNVDVSTTKGNVRDWGVIGIAFLGGNSGVVSLHRIVQSATDDEQIRRRPEIVAAHEVGHMLGLPHCAEAGCFMQDAEGTLANVDSATGQLGPECQKAYEEVASMRRAR